MTWLAKVCFHLRTLFAKRKLDEQLSEEVRMHVEMATEANLAKGMPSDEARNAALREFGNVASVQERTRDERGWVWLEQLGQDIRYGTRSLRKSPFFVGLAVLSLAIGIGANTALFSLVDDVLLRSLPVRNPDELVVFRWLSSNAPYEGIVGQPLQDTDTGLTMDTVLSLPLYERLRDQSSAVDEVFAFAPLASLVIRSDTRVDQGRGQLVSGNYFPALGVNAWRGRLLNPQDDLPGAAPVAVLSYRFWQQSLGGDEGVLGRVLTINHVPSTVVGITPLEFIGALQPGQAPDVTLPLSSEPHLQKGWSFTERPHIWWLHIMGRLKPGMTAAQAQAQIEPVYRQSMQEARQLISHKVDPKEAEPRDMLRLERGGQGLTDIRQTYRFPLAVLTGLVGLVLLLACVNVANLSLARSAVRCREIALRLSLGATRGRVVRQLLLESVLLAMSGGVCGLLLARWGRSGLLQLWPVGDGGPLLIDQRILGFAFVISLVTALSCGLLPAWQASCVDLNSVLKTSGGGSQRTGWRRSLTVVQVALSMVLLTGAALFGTTLWNLRGIDAGFSRSNLLLFNITAAEAGYSEAQAALLFEQIQTRIAALPEVESAAFANLALLLGEQSGTTVRTDSPHLPPGRWHQTGVNSISPEFRSTLGIPLLSGRDLTRYDARGGPPVVLVNEAFARAYFPGEGAVGRSITFNGSVAFKTEDRTAEIVGVIGNTRYADLRRNMEPIVFVPYAQASLTFGDASFMIRTSTLSDGLPQAIRQVVREIEPAIPLVDFRTQNEQVDRLFARERFFAALSVLLGGFALVLTCIGLYGLLAHEVTIRTKEIGIRMALGARIADILRLVMRAGLGLVLLGCLLGIGGSLACSRLITRFLYGITPVAPGVFMATAFLLMVVAGFACWLPARRAARVDPVIALRAE